MTLDDDLAEEELHRLAQEGTDEEKRAVARHPNASLRALLCLAEEGFAKEVDQNPMLLLYMEMGSYEIVKILEKVAKHTQRVERLEELATLIWYEVRRGVAWNPMTPPATLSLLAKDEEEFVRDCVAKNSNTTSATLSFLAKDKDDDVRIRVAENANTPPTTLSLLANDKFRYVSSAARATLTKLQKAT